MNFFSSFDDRKNVEDYQFYRDQNARNSHFRRAVDDEIDSIISNPQQNGSDMVEITDELNEIYGVDNQSECDPSVEYVNAYNILPPNDHLTNSDVLFQQISEQMQKIGNATMSNNERTEEMQYELYINQPHWLEVAKIPPDGSCLFGTVVHQLFGHRINSDAHVQATRQLRQNVVQHISRNFSSFEGAIQCRVEDVYDLRQMENNYEACQIFLNDYLTSGNVWGGQETIQAVQEIYGVNILIFREPNSYNYFHRFNEPNTRVLMLAYRLGNKLNRLSHNHYDSVCNIDADEIRYLAEFLTEKHLRNQ